MGLRELRRTKTSGQPRLCISASISAASDVNLGLSRQVLGRSVKHTLIVHHNVLNGLYLHDALEMFRAKGWQLINAADAFRDPVFKSAPKVAPMGNSLIWALAKETGKFEKLLREPGEDSVYEKDAMDKLGL